MCTVCSTKCIVHEQISKLGELFSQLWIVLFFSWIETHILKHQHITIVQCSYFRFCYFTNSFVSFSYSFA
ncbi:hypothetical protein D3C76_1391200 [compost metagenome]